MTITIAPLTVNTTCDSEVRGRDRGREYLGNCIAPQFGRENKGYDEKNLLPITYWGIYLDDKYISYTSSKELAEKTKLWIQKWLEDRL